MMQRFAILLLLTLSTGASAESTSTLAPNNAVASHQRRELSVSDWWYTLLNHLHVPCPPPEHRQGHCGHHSHHSGSSSKSGSGSGGSSGSGGGTSSSSSGGWSDDGYSGGNGGGGGGGWNDDGHGGNNKNSNGNNDDDGDYYMTADDEWSSDGWESSNLDGTGKGAASGKVGIKAENIAPFVIGALVAGIIGAAFVVTRKRRQQEDEAHPLEGSLKKRMKLFSGGVFRRNKKGMLDDDLEEGGGSPAFVEISSVKSGAASVHSGSYIAPSASVIEGFDNESDDSDDDDM